jgi:hypothetical protein
MMSGPRSQPQDNVIRGGGSAMPKQSVEQPVQPLKQPELVHKDSNPLFNQELEMGGKLDIQNPNKPQKQFQNMKSLNQGQEAQQNSSANTGADSSDSGGSDAESMDEELTQEIFNYLVGIKEQGDTIIDISDTIIGDKGAMMVAEMIQDCN